VCHTRFYARRTSFEIVKSVGNHLFLLIGKAPWTAPVAIAVFETAQCQRPSRASLTPQCSLQRYPPFTHGTKLDILSARFPEHP